MPRKGSVSKRKVTPDSRFGDVAITKFINSLMLDGKKSKAERIFYDALDIAGEKLKKSPFEVFEQAMENVKPLIEVRSRRVGGATYQVPMEVNPFRRQTLAIRWLVAASRNRSANSMTEKLANELMDAAQGKGGAIKKKEDTSKMAEANRAFAHYRW
jgi:small subunit ribosomal protein S7